MSLASVDILFSAPSWSTFSLFGSHFLAIFTIFPAKREPNRKNYPQNQAQNKNVNRTYL